MSETFEVGQKVRIDDRADGEITYGPFPSTHGTFTGYVVRTDAGERLQRAHDLVAIPEPPAFAVGDKVQAGWLEKYAAKIVAGPFISRAGDGTFYIVEDETGKHGFPTEAVLTKVVEPEPIKAGDKVRVTDDDGGGRNRFNGREGVVISVGEYSSLPYLVEFGDGSGYHGDVNGTWHCGGVERITDEDSYTHDGVTVLLSGAYRDSDGDEWRFRRVGEDVRAAAYGDEPDEDSQTADGPIARWAPFARV